MDQIEQARPFDGWGRAAYTRNRRDALQTHLPLDEEYWLALRYPAEVADAGMAQIATTNPQFMTLPPDQQRELWREFRAYVRQAEGFYRGACVLPWKSSPLNYYYSFMNLAKAAAVARGCLAPRPPQQPRMLKHGLSARVLPDPTDAWKISVRATDGVFPLLYKAAVGVPVADGTELNARELLSYVPSISMGLPPGVLKLAE